MRQGYGSVSRGGRSGSEPSNRLSLDTQALMRELDEPQAAASDNGWAVGYLDLLLLLVTLFAALLGITYLQREHDDNKPDGVWLFNLSQSVIGESALIPIEPESLLAAYTTRPALPQASPKPPPASPGKPPSKPLDSPIHGDIILASPRAEEPEPLLDFDPGQLARLVSDLRDDGMGVEVEQSRVRVEMQDEILFSLGKADLSDAGKAVLDRLVDGLVSQDILVRVQGHTDDLPIQTAQFPSNWELSSFRATTVARYLIDRGVERGRLLVSGHADTQPRVANDSPENRAMNRRVTLVLEQWPADEVPQSKAVLLEEGNWTEL